MLTPLKFRHRIGLLVALAAAALITVTAVALVLGRRGEQQLAGIETRYVPLIELDRDLKTRFAQIPQTLEDAANAAEDSGLLDADVVYADLQQRLRAGRQILLDNGGDPAALETELAGYYARARAIAAALIAGTPAAEVGSKIEAMGHARELLGAKLDAATTPDRRRLAAAFAGARASQRDALRIDIVVAISALVLIGFWSWRLIRQTVSALHAVTAGVERLARGDFAQEITVTTSDELGDLARQANRTAARLREYRDQAGRDAAELGEAYATLETRNATLVAAQQLLEERAGELARASRYKSQFLANMSHELRTPLNSIMILSKVLAENPPEGGPGETTSKQVEFAQLIHRSGEELLALINEVLDLAKIEAGKQVLVCDALPVAELRDYVHRMFQPLAVHKALAFKVEGAGDLPEVIRTDWARLAQILKNLIANAFKFTESGGVTVRVARGLPQGWQGDAISDPITISVTDSGIGIAADKHAWVFEAFAQADSGISRKFGGTGLGLTIAKQLATRLGGDLIVASTLGVGSTFSLALPIAGPPSEPPPRSAEASVPAARLPSLSERSVRLTGPPYLLGAIDSDEPDPALDGKTVLVVDDDMRNVYALSNALRTQRLEVITAADGQEALDELDRRADLHLVLMDMRMPRMDGEEAIRRIRAQPRFHALPIIALTAETVPGEREACLAAGANDCVPKPVDIGHLSGVLHIWLGRR